MSLQAVLRALVDLAPGGGERSSRCARPARRRGGSQPTASSWCPPPSSTWPAVDRVDYKEILLSLSSIGVVIGECFE
jgi:hypothetical protein